MSKLEKDETSQSDFNPTLSFPTEDIALASAGSGILHLIRIHKDLDTNQWRHLATGPLHDFHDPISILNSYLDPATGIIHALVLSLKDFEENEKTPVSHGLLHWLQISKNVGDDVECTVRKWKTLKGRNLPQDCWLSDDFTQLFVSSESEFELVNVVTYGMFFQTSVVVCPHPT